MAANRYYQGSPTPGTSGGGYKQTPDQRDRNEDHFRKAAGARPKVNPKKQIRRHRLPWHGKKPPGGLGNYRGGPSSDRPTNS